MEILDDLNSTDFETKKAAVKKTIALMSIGKDCSDIFQGHNLTKGVLNCIEFEELELKKLVYLYIINYAKIRPDEAIMSINSFLKDIKKFINLEFT